MNQPEVHSHPSPVLTRAPIIEAVVDIDCDLPPVLEVDRLERTAREALQPQYPKLRKVFVEQHRIQTTADQPSVHSAGRAVQAFQFLQEDERQLVQGRVNGFSFNRLAPYTSLDEYLPEIERTWRLFVDIAAPVQVRGVRLRYINRIRLPASSGTVRLENYLRQPPQTADETLQLAGFLSQYNAVEVGTRHHAGIVLTMQPFEGGFLPIILDISVGALGAEDPSDWNWILDKIQALRSLKNRVFQNTLTETCFKLFH